ncbi:MAG: hypothetical protein R3A80_04990 [Bdellovibrionota bacterium]
MKSVKVYSVKMCYEMQVDYSLDPIAQDALSFLTPILKRHSLSFGESLGIPLLEEAERIAGMWESLEKASEQDLKRNLFVVFINQRASASKSAIDSNLRTLDFFSIPHDFKFSLNPLGRDYAFVINGSLEPFFLKENEGVGRARKVPADLALALWKQGFLESEIHRQTDADVRVPDTYFLTELKKNEVAATYPYFHTQGN